MLPSHVLASEDDESFVPHTTSRIAGCPASGQHVVSRKAMMSAGAVREDGPRPSSPPPDRSSRDGKVEAAAVRAVELADQVAYRPAGTLLIMIHAYAAFVKRKIEKPAWQAPWSPSGVGNLQPPRGKMHQSIEIVYRLDRLGLSIRGPRRSLDMMGIRLRERRRCE